MIKSISAISAILFSALVLVACASNEPQPQPDYDAVRSNAAEAYQELDNNSAE